jgi:hypothetical protein
MALAGLVGATPGASWGAIARTLVVPVDRRTHIVRNYDGHRATDEKGHTPDAAAALLLFSYDAGAKVEAATFRRAVELADRYVGSPMLSALLGVFAARLGERARALELFERGYADFILEPFTVTDEYSAAAFPEQERVGPFMANLSGFLLSCLYGLTGLRLGPDEPAAWCRRPPLLPRGWHAVEVERVWARGGPARLVARHGADRAQLHAEEISPARRSS